MSCRLQPLNGDQTFTVPDRAIRDMLRCQHGPVPAFSVSASNMKDLLGNRFVEIVVLPGQFPIMVGQPTAHMKITDVGRDVLATLKKLRRKKVAR